MKLKGISPLVAAVLLIAVTMTIAGVLAYWGSTFIRGQTDQFSNQTIVTECKFMNFEIDACSYDSGTSTLTFIVDNVGTVPVERMEVIARYPNLQLANATVAGAVESGRLGSFTAGPLTSGWESLELRTQCPDVSKTISC